MGMEASHSIGGKNSEKIKIAWNKYCWWEIEIANERIDEHSNKPIYTSVSAVRIMCDVRILSIGDENRNGNRNEEKRCRQWTRAQETDIETKRYTLNTYNNTVFAVRAHALFMFNQSYKCKLIHGAHTQYSTFNGLEDGREKPKQSTNGKNASAERARQNITAIADVRRKRNKYYMQL